MTIATTWLFFCARHRGRISALDKQVVSLGLILTRQPFRTMPESHAAVTPISIVQFFNSSTACSQLLAPALHPKFEMPDVGMTHVAVSSDETASAKIHIAAPGNPPAAMPLPRLKWNSGVKNTHGGSRDCSVPWSEEEQAFLDTFPKTEYSSLVSCCEAIATDLNEMFHREAWEQGKPVRTPKAVRSRLQRGLTDAEGKQLYSRAGKKRKTAEPSRAAAYEKE